MAETLSMMGENMQSHFVKQAVDMRDHCDLRFQENGREVYRREMRYNEVILEEYVRIKAEDLKEVL